MAKRTLTLKKELLAELTADDLQAVVAAGSLPPNCAITVLQHGCPSDPRICHYYTQMC